MAENPTILYRARGEPNPSNFLSVVCAETGGCNSTVRSGTAYATAHSRDSAQCATTVEVERKDICYLRLVHNY